MLFYAGVPLPLATAEIADWVRDRIDPSWLVEWTERTWPGHQLEHVGWRGFWRPGPVRLGVLTWPVGAARFAVGHYLADEVAVAAVRQKGVRDGKPQPLDLVIADGRPGRAVTVPLYALPPRPLDRVAAGVPGLYLLTLVDDRYYWWYKSGVIGGDSWTAVYASIGTLLGVKVEADAVADAYRTPPVDLLAAYRPLPVLFDAVAYSVGHRVVRTLEGRVVAQGWSNAVTTHLGNLARFDRLAGDSLDLGETVRQLRT